MLLLKWVGKKGKKAGCGIYPQNQTARSTAYIECKLLLFSEQMILIYITIVSAERRSWIVFLFWKDKFDLIV